MLDFTPVTLLQCQLDSLLREALSMGHDETISTEEKLKQLHKTVRECVLTNEVVSELIEEEKAIKPTLAALDFVVFEEELSAAKTPKARFNVVQKYLDMLDRSYLAGERDAKFLEQVQAEILLTPWGTD